MLKMAMLGGGAALAGLMQATAQAEPSAKDQQRAGAPSTAPRAACRHRRSATSASIGIGGGGVNDSMVVKVETDQAGLYG